MRQQKKYEQLLSLVLYLATSVAILAFFWQALNLL